MRTFPTILAIFSSILVGCFEKDKNMLPLFSSSSATLSTHNLSAVHTNGAQQQFSVGENPGKTAFELKISNWIELLIIPFNL